MQTQWWLMLLIGKGSSTLKLACVNLTTTTWKLIKNIYLKCGLKVLTYISTVHFLFNEPSTKRLLALQSIGQSKGGSKTSKKMLKVQKISSVLHLSKWRTKDQKTKLSYSHWLQWWPYLSWSNRISLIKLIWLTQLLHNEFLSVKKIDWWIQ